MTDTREGPERIWPDRLKLRDTGLHDDMGGSGQRIYTTAGQGYAKEEYVRSDLLAAAEAERDGWRKEHERVCQEAADCFGNADEIDAAWDAIGTRGNKATLSLDEQVSSLLRELEAAEAERDALREALAVAADQLKLVAGWVEHCGNPIHAGIVRGWAADALRPAPEEGRTACPDCDGAGMRDSGGVQPWGEPIHVPCDCGSERSVSRRDPSAEESIPDLHDHCAECGEPMPNQNSSWCDRCRYDGPWDEDGEPIPEEARDRAGTAEERADG